MSLPGRAARSVAHDISTGEVLSLRKLWHGASMGAHGSVSMGRSAARMERMGGQARRLEGARLGLGGARSRAAHIGMPSRAIPRPSGRGALEGARAGLHSPQVVIPRPAPMRGLAGMTSGLDRGPMRRYVGSLPAPPRVRPKWGRTKKAAKIWGGAMGASTGAAMYMNHKTSAKSAGLPAGSTTGMYGM